MEELIKRLNKKVVYFTESVDATTRGDHWNAKYFLLFHNTNTLIHAFDNEEEVVTWLSELINEDQGIFLGYQIIK